MELAALEKARRRSALLAKQKERNSRPVKLRRKSHETAQGRAAASHADAERALLPARGGPAEDAEARRTR